MLGLDVNMAILSAGFNAFGGYNTLGINTRARMDVSVPRELFSLLKEGISNSTYDISDLGFHADAFVEVALGHSRQINSQWRVGGKLKFLLGAANVDASFDKATLTLGQDRWTAVTNARLQANIKGLSFLTDQNNTTGEDYVSDFEIGDFGLGGFGMAVDLGGSFRLNDDWEFSASVLDLGFIDWNTNMLASTNGDKTFDTDKYTFSADENASNNFDDEIDRMGDDLAALYEMNDMGDTGGRTTALAATLNLAAQYNFPLYRPLSFGLVNSTRFAGPYTWTRFRLSANVAPSKLFSAGANIAMGTCGFEFGWMINFHPNGFNLFLAMDRTLGRITKQGIPYSSNANLNLGINFPF